MNKPHIIIIDDQIDVLSTLRNDLSVFREKFVLDDCESATEAMELIEELYADGEQIALVLSDHIMPVCSGIDFLSELNKDDRFGGIFKVLVTGQASHADTINAINNAAINFYINKPWDVESLHDVVKKMITNWVLENDMDYQDFEGLIDSETLYSKMKSQ